MFKILFATLFCTYLTKSFYSLTGLLYVGQHEFACTFPSDPSARTLGSSDATTCHVAALRHPTTGVTALAHLDGADGMASNLAALADRVFEISDRLCPTEEGDAR